MSVWQLCMRNAAAKLKFIIHTFNVTFNYKSHGDIKKEGALFNIWSKPKVNIQLRWISLFSKSSWITTTASGLSYELGVNGEKKVNGNWDIINKNGHSTFHTGKPGNFNSLREVIWIILWHCYLEIDWRWESVPKKVLWLLTSFRWYV